MIGKLKLSITDGVQDYLPDECYNKRKIEYAIREFFYLSGISTGTPPAMRVNMLYMPNEG